MGSACGKSVQPDESPQVSSDAAKAKPAAAAGGAAAGAAKEEPKREEEAKPEPRGRSDTIEGEGELATEGLLPKDEAFSNVKDMDEPKYPRKLSADTTIPADSGMNSPPAGQAGPGKKRFRKRSVNITTLPDDQLKEVDMIFAEIDKEGTGFISREAVARVLKENYRPSQLEVEEVMQWMDSTGDGNIRFDEYTVAMASVMTKAGLNEDNDIETARAALSAEMQKRTIEAKEGQPPAKMEASEENVKNAQKFMGEDILNAMKERFNGLDKDSKGFLEKDDVRELVRLTYTAPKENIDAFMRFFDLSCTDKISLQEFTHGLTLLYGDFSFVVKANNRMIDGVIRSPSYLGPSASPDVSGPIPPPDEAQREEPAAAAADAGA